MMCSSVLHCICYPPVRFEPSLTNPLPNYFTQATGNRPLPSLDKNGSPLPLYALPFLSVKVHPSWVSQAPRVLSYCALDAAISHVHVFFPHKAVPQIQTYQVSRISRETHAFRPTHAHMPTEQNLTHGGKCHAY